MLKSLFCVLCVVLVSQLQAIEGKHEQNDFFPHFAVLDRNENFWLYWDFDDAYITFEVQGKTSGWVGVGFSPNGGMNGADIYVGWVKDGVAHITDRQGSNGNGYPPKDSEQNVELVSGSECDGWTTIRFRRQIPACDGADWMLTTDTTKVIWALGFTDPEGEDITTSHYHGNGAKNRGTKSIFLLESNGGSQTLPETSTASFDLLNEKIHLPPRDTYYNCKLIKVPDFPSKRHVISIQPIIQEENIVNVHHFVLYHCVFNEPKDPSAVGISHECYTPNMPQDFQSCRSPIHAWAVGGGVFTYPDHVGFPLGESDSPKYVILETHYDNPGLRSDIVDSSGMRLIYTDQLRQYDGSIMEVGQLPSPYGHIIPPNTASFPSYSECPSQCLDGAMGHIERTDLRIIGTFLHTHLLGRKIVLRHLTANGSIELPPIAQDNSYDFNYQEVKVFSDEVIFQKGESMQVVCDYSSEHRPVVTVGGLGTRNEMCIAFVFYYPKVPMPACLSTPIPNIFYKTGLGVTNFTFTSGSAYSTLDDVLVNSPDRYVNMSLADVIKKTEWTEEASRRLNIAQRDSKRSYFCPTLVRTNNAFTWEALPPEITEPYQPPPATCVASTHQKATKRNVDHCHSSSDHPKATVLIGGVCFYFIALALSFVF